jgi:3-deoxy-D-manno-octulosonic-acid transferase
MDPLRGLYSLLWYAALRWRPLRLLRRGRREPGYRDTSAERWPIPGYSPVEVVWVHAVSLGETRAAAPLIERLRRAYPTPLCC